MAIIISQKGKKARKIEQSPLDQEIQLQEYIIENPESLPFYDIDEDIQLFIACREFPTNSGPIDALAFDQDGQIYVVEMKLYKNPDKRLVIAQVLDYGASMSFSFADFAEFLNLLDQKTNQFHNVGIRQKFMDFFGLEEDTVEQLIDAVRLNLDEGNFKFVVLMDQIEPRLKDLIRFLNHKSRFDVYGVELDFYKFDSYQIVIPKLYGSEAKKDIGVSKRVTRQWDEASFFAELEKREKGAVPVARKIMDWCRNQGFHDWFGTGKRSGSYFPVLDHNGVSYTIIGLWTYEAIEFQFQHLIKKPPFDLDAKRAELLAKFNNALKMKLSQDSINYRPSIKYRDIKGDKMIRDFLGVLEWFVREVKSP